MELDNKQHEAFALAYIACFGNAAEAARRAGYSDDNARQQGWRLLERPDVRGRIDELSDARFRSAEVEAADILRELMRIAMCDIADAFEKDTNGLKDIHDMPIDVRRAVSSVKVDEIFTIGKKGEKALVGYTKEIKFWNKDRGLEMLARTLSLFKDSLTVRNHSEAKEARDDTANYARVASIFEAARARVASGEDLV